MKQFTEIDPSMWGYQTTDLAARKIVDRLVDEVADGISNYSILSIELEPSTDRECYQRVYSELPVSEELFDLFFNSRSGYRAQFFAGEEIGELFNAYVVEAIAPMLIESASLYTEYVYRELCERSLTASHTKVWFP